MSHKKIIGAIFLVAGTSIGAGMLGLPIASAQAGTLNASLLFVGAWALMTFAAFLTLEVHCCFPKDQHIISMASATLGYPGKLVCWTLYLLFLYSLVAAYIAGGQDLLHHLLHISSFTLPLWACGILFVLLFGSLVMAGVKQVDKSNQVLMAIKLISLSSVLVFIAPHMHTFHLAFKPIQTLSPAITISITSFGFSIIVPTLRNYFDDDLPALRWSLLVGSLLPLVVYLVWNASILNIIPLDGRFGLSPLFHATQPISGLLHAIQYAIHEKHVVFLSRLFSSICVLTAFLCVSLGLSDYLADGMRKIKFTYPKLMLGIVTFLPPLSLALYYPRAFLVCLSLAGFFCLLLQVVMPIMMTYSSRYVKNMETTYQVSGGKISLIIASLVVIMLLFLM